MKLIGNQIELTFLQSLGRNLVKASINEQRNNHSSIHISKIIDQCERAQNGQIYSRAHFRYHELRCKEATWANESSVSAK